MIDGVALLERATTILEANGQGRSLPFALTNLGEAYLLADRREEALAATERALRFAREQGHRQTEARGIYVLARIEAHGATPDVEGAEAHYGEVLALATEFGMRPLVAHCHLGLGKLYRQTGDARRRRST